MKLKYNFVTNEVADKIVAVAVGDDLEKFNGFVKMDKTAASIFDLLKEEESLEDLIAKVMALYPKEPEAEVRQVVLDVVDYLQKSGVLE